MRVIKLMPDYQCFPLWEASSGKVGNIDPESLPITGELKKKLTEWAREYDATLNLDDPMASGFQSPDVEVAFKIKGRELGEQLEQELDASFNVVVDI